MNAHMFVTTRSPGSVQDICHVILREYDRTGLPQFMMRGSSFIRDQQLQDLPNHRSMQAMQTMRIRIESPAHTRSVDTGTRLIEGEHASVILSGTAAGCHSTTPARLSVVRCRGTTRRASERSRVTCHQVLYQDPCLSNCTYSNEVRSRFGNQASNDFSHRASPYALVRCPVRIGVTCMRFRWSIRHCATDTEFVADSHCRKKW